MNYVPKFLNSKWFWYSFILMGFPFLLSSYIIFYSKTSIESDPFLNSFDFWFMFLAFLAIGMLTIISGVIEITKINIPIKYIEIRSDRKISLDKWRSECLKRDKNKCVLCTSKENLDVHHIAPKSIYPELKVNLSNGITLCKDHHLFAHELYRRLQNVCTITAKNSGYNSKKSEKRIKIKR